MEDGFLPEYHHSIFYHLIEYASDTDSKLILLDQILEVGDKKEIPLLEELENCSELVISNKAFHVKEQLLSNIKVTELEDELMPMSLCFLYEEFDIKPPKIDIDLDIDFELTLDIFKTELSDSEK
ncbi:hypothetical protein LV716_16755 [Flagellimonas sp. HMM57]|uniref:hypothetical protein n=1 Tax=unclassified Flagellimonas TaxID=2644544 RepID=UPI0013D48D2F|nr:MULTISPECIES: hypothetical protein [unclassified Flagellimonas]UII75892.1 hypothetical protein LV716_16755 [Flagellimonas sp. HMM57]